MYEEAKGLPRTGRLVERLITSADKKGAVRDMDALAAVPPGVLFEFCILFARTLAADPSVLDSEMLEDMPELAQPAFEQALDRWREIRQDVEKMPVPKRGRPASGHPEVLDRLAREILRHSQAARGLKEEANRVAAAVGVKYGGGKIETYLREIQMERRKSR